MDSSYWNQDSSSKNAYSNSFNYKEIIRSKNLFIDKTPKKNNSIKTSKILNENYKKHDFNYLVYYLFIKLTKMIII